MSTNSIEAAHCPREDYKVTLYITTYLADVVELVDTHALGACAFGREGSSPFIRTKEKTGQYDWFFLLAI